VVLRMGSEEKAKAEPEARGQQRKRGALDRMQRGVARATAAEGEEEADEDEDGQDRGERRNAQKEQKKQEKKAAQQADKRQREQKEANKSEKQQKYTEKQQEREAERLRKEQEEQKAKLEKEQKEKEEFDQWKQMFAVEAEGEMDDGRDASVVERFIEHIKIRKVVNLEDLAADFQMRTTSVIDRIRELEKLNRLSGVLDDRGKYVYISPEEMTAVAEWLKRRGRVSRTDLIAACNRIIRLNPTEADKAKLDEEARLAADALEVTEEA